ncbi:1-aminocyclopropane-1-carboxylate oxidase 1-like protein, partial [Trifolium pratense]
GLVDAGITKIPQMFIHPHDNTKKISNSSDTTIPLIDLANIHDDPSARRRVVESVRYASETFGFFHIINHGIPVSTMKEMKEGVLNFNEQDTTWKDSFLCNMAPVPPKPEDLPEICRDILLEYLNQVMKLGTLLFELLSEALGLNPNYLKDIGCTEGFYAFGQYYPKCPQPELTSGALKHADGVFLTVLLQDHVGGLQLLHKDRWIDITPIPEALIINIGDLLQACFRISFEDIDNYMS